MESRKVENKKNEKITGGKEEGIGEKKGREWEGWIGEGIRGEGRWR